MKNVLMKDFWIGKGEQLAVMCGPCVIESEEHTMRMAEALKTLFAKRPLNLIFKASYDKANRSSIKSFRGPGLEKGLRILERVRRELDLPVVSDVHTVLEAQTAGQLLDCLQIPAFLCRQTDLILAAAETGKVVSIKKGQFMAPLDMKNVIDKCYEVHNEKVILIERGTTFGYNNLVCDMRAIPMMQSLGVPVCFDATHGVQLPGGLGASSGGERQYIFPLACAAIAAGANCLFIEAHDHPDKAKSDAATVLDFKELPRLLDLVEKLYAVAQGHAV
jgi:2-dehydro-3-deoxyphosphooctonate aldolase (KDO 8-P synthase)